MSETAPRRNPRLDDFEANKAAYERKQFEQALYDTAGTSDFSDAAHRRVIEADEYERHLASLAGRAPLDTPPEAEPVVQTVEPSPQNTPELSLPSELELKLRALRDMLLADFDSLSVPTPDDHEDTPVDTPVSVPEVNNDAADIDAEVPPLPEDLIEELDIRPDPAMRTQAVLAEELWPNTTTEISHNTSRMGYTDAERIFKRVQIRGDGQLTPELLEQANLMPHHRLETEGETIWFSHGYDIGGGRIAAVGYVQDDDGSVVARSYYRSNSQGVWRYLPQYQKQDGRITWYSKGYGEESVTLPAALQEGLTRSIEDDGGILELDTSTAQTAFSGTARRVGAEGTVYHRRVNEYPRKLNGIPEKDGYELPRPETIQPQPEQAPRFDIVQASWEQDTDLYGHVTFEAIPSHDGTLLYVFCQDERGRAWISGIENKSPLESTGLRTAWVSGGVLTTPAYEYASQAGDFGNLNDRQGHYVDMFERYLSKIPVIQDYIATKQ